MCCSCSLHALLFASRRSAQEINNGPTSTGGKATSPYFLFPCFCEKFQSHCQCHNAICQQRITYTARIFLSGSISVGAKCTPAHFFSYTRKSACTGGLVDNVAIGIVVIWHPHNWPAHRRTMQRVASERPPEQKTAAFWKTFALCFGAARGPRALFNFPHLSSSRSFGARERRGRFLERANCTWC
jgi:hypothetical protein